jgi:hypothetical protein
MWNDEEDNNPYGSLEDGPTSPGGCMLCNRHTFLHSRNEA